VAAAKQSDFDLQAQRAIDASTAATHYEMTCSSYSWQLVSRLSTHYADCNNTWP
jgi:hypothetical protein